jgi:hypothetical protein
MMNALKYASWILAAICLPLIGVSAIVWSVNINETFVAGDVGAILLCISQCVANLFGWVALYWLLYLQPIALAKVPTFIKIGMGFGVVSMFWPLQMILIGLPAMVFAVVLVLRSILVGRSQYEKDGI